MRWMLLGRCSVGKSNRIGTYLDMSVSGLEKNLCVVGHICIIAFCSNSTKFQEPLVDSFDHALTLAKGFAGLTWESAQLIESPTLMGSDGVWVFVVDVTKGLKRRTFL